jgi:hypothetical protein
MGASTSAMPPVSTPKYYTIDKEILSDPYYQAHFKYSLKEDDKEEALKEKKPYMAMAKFYQLQEGASDAYRLAILLDQRLRLNGDHCLRLLDHGPSPNKNLYVGYWEYPTYTLEREVIERRGSVLSIMQVSKVTPIYIVLQ